MNKLMFVFGTRPEFIKLYPVIMEARRRQYDVTVVNTGQHREMLDQLLDEMGMSADFDLKVMTQQQSLADILARTIVPLDKVVGQVRPDHIFVHGDTSATLAGSIISLYRHVPLSHVEAGLRTYNKYSPFPEEMNRQLTGVLADYHFTPTEATQRNLLREGKDPERIFVVGNSAIDMLGYTIRPAFRHPVLDELGDRKLILVTVHRRENLSELNQIFTAINEIGLRYGDSHQIVYPIHMNPVVRQAANQYLTAPSIRIIEPLGTTDFHNILNRSHIVMTDSGGIQEEAPSLGKPVLVLRDTTERPEGVEAGTLRLVGTARDDIVRDACRLLDDDDEYRRMAAIANPYGNGTTAQQMMDVMDKIRAGEPLSTAAVSGSPEHGEARDPSLLRGSEPSLPRQRKSTSRT
ncbi:UDP-N-acetylglucosamine 2-epimerase (non-hydrolyzing) [Actinoplanes sp. NPDC051346]|uniref:non-hydrolyzing UDP-N-acetylglucosamine 2-epimerase n=1 Tax=Actinoplanes sp. NPDC051346 TaxID=3155048 RepID=UPI003427D1E7